MTVQHIQSVLDVPEAAPKQKKQATPRRAISLGMTAMSVLSAASEVEAVPIARGFKASVNGLLVDGEPTFHQCEKVGLTLRVFERGAPFALGDFVNYVETRFGEAAAQIIDSESGWSEKTVAVYRWMSGRIAQEDRRMDRLGIRHHLLVAALTPAQQRKWLAQAAADDQDGPWTVSRLAAAIQANDDVSPSALWVLVLATSQADQSALMASLESQGRTVKALVRHGKPKAKKS